MRIMYTTALAALLMLSCRHSHEKQTSPAEEVRQAIAASNAIYFQSFEKNDPAIFINAYAKDACIMAPFAPQACGPTEALHFFRTAYDVYGLRNGKFITTAIYGDGKEYVSEEGLWQSFNDKGELFDDGKYLVLWKKTADGWKMYRDAFSSNRSLPPVQEQQKRTILVDQSTEEVPETDIVYLFWKIHFI